jgi:predicted HNH restriction endonuclease
VAYKDPEVKKQKQKIYARAHYEKNRKYYIGKAADQRKSQREKWAIFKSTLSCQNCGFSHPQALDFHHVNPSPDDQKVYILVGRGRIRAAFEEIKKCAVLCANCHRMLHNDPEFEKQVIKKISKMTRRTSL